MNDLQGKALLAGVAFGIWPLVMNRSGLSGNVSSFVFGIAVALCVSPFALSNLHGGSFAGVDWKMVFLAGGFGGVGLLFFNGMLARAKPQDLGSLFVMMIVTQTMVAAIYQVIVARTLAPSRGAGFLLAIIAAILLAR